MLAVLNRVGFIAPDPLLHGRCHERTGFASAPSGFGSIAAEGDRSIDNEVCLEEGDDEEAHVADPSSDWRSRQRSCVPPAGGAWYLDRLDH